MHPMSDGTEHGSALSITLFSPTELAAISRIHPSLPSSSRPPSPSAPCWSRQSSIPLAPRCWRAIRQPPGGRASASFPCRPWGRPFPLILPRTWGQPAKLLSVQSSYFQTSATAEKSLICPNPDPETSHHYIKRVRQRLPCCAHAHRLLCRTPLYAFFCYPPVR